LKKQPIRKRQNAQFFSITVTKRKAGYTNEENHRNSGTSKEEIGYKLKAEYTNCNQHVNCETKRKIIGICASRLARI
jgi:hypothetical protein